MISSSVSCRPLQKSMMQFYPNQPMSHQRLLSSSQSVVPVRRGKSQQHTLVPCKSHETIIMSSRSSSKQSCFKSKLENNRIFVYKIIHDLRHPTEALAIGLKNLHEKCKSANPVAKRVLRRTKSANSLEAFRKEKIVRKEKLDLFEKAAERLNRFLTHHENEQKQNHDVRFNIDHERDGGESKQSIIRENFEEIGDLQRQFWSIPF